MSRPKFCLTYPTDGAASTRRTYGRFLKMLARDVLRLPPSVFSPGRRQVAREVQGLCRRFGDTDPSSLYRVLRRPDVHGLLTCAYRAIGDGDGEAASHRAEAFIFQLLLELALDGALPGPVRWPGPPPQGALRSVSHRMFCEGLGDGTEVRFTPGAVQVLPDSPPGLNEPPSDRFLPVADGMHLALVDNNPISDFEAHPDKEGNALDLGDADASGWVQSLITSLSVVERYLPELRQEMDLFLQQFIPVGTDEQSHLSASYREMIGAMYLTLHPQQMTMTEALIHEYQHSKINVLFHLEAVMDNAYWPLYASPVRPDPRPLHGVLLAAHAFVPVAEMYVRMMAAEAPEARRGGFMDRFRQILAKNGEALAVLKENAEPTKAGRQVIDELDSYHRSHLALGI